MTFRRLWFQFSRRWGRREKHPIENALTTWSIFFYHVICTIVPKYRLKLFFNAMGVHQVEPGMTSY